MYNILYGYPCNVYVYINEVTLKLYKIESSFSTRLVYVRWRKCCLVADYIQSRKI